MKDTTLRWLLAANVVLLLVLATVTYGPKAMAQFGGAQGHNYVMVAGQTPNRPSESLYIVDLNNEAVLTVTYNFSRRKLEAIAFRNVSRDAEARPQR